MSNQWSNKLRERMEVHQEPSPEGLWNDIEKVILAEGLHTQMPVEKPKKVTLWVKRISVAAVLLILAMSIGYLVINNNPVHTPQIVETYKETPTSTIDNTKTIAEAKEIEQEEEEQIIDNSLPSNTPKNEKQIIGNKSTNHNHIVDTQKGEQLNEIDTPKQKLEEKEEEIQSSKPDKSANKDLYANKSKSLEPEPDLSWYKIEKEKKSGWSTGLYASNLTSGAANKQGGYTNLSAYALTQESYEGEPAIKGNAFGKILLANQYSEIYTDIKHKQPIVAGLTANYNLDDTWSIKSGITYSYLSSKLHSGSDNNYYASDQNLHFIGLPININYSIWDNRSLKVYTSVGGMMEKNISGKLTTDYIVNNQLEHTKKENISIDRLQWSVNAAAGIQYNLTKMIGLYFEPGVSYHFNNNSKVETIYQEKPFNLSLRLGLNFSLSGN